MSLLTIPILRKTFRSVGLVFVGLLGAYSLMSISVFLPLVITALRQEHLTVLNLLVPVLLLTVVATWISVSLYTRNKTLFFSVGKYGIFIRPTSQHHPVSPASSSSKTQGVSE